MRYRSGHGQGQLPDRGRAAAVQGRGEPGCSPGGAIGPAIPDCAFHLIGAAVAPDFAKYPMGIVACGAPSGLGTLRRAIGFR